MLVSVIVPCYNQGIYILESVKSVINQTFTDWEIIIVNDGSDDNETNKILTELVIPKVRIIHTENKGVSAARNTGITAAKGIYILPLDADDIIGKKYLQEAVALLDANVKVKVVYCNGAYFGNENGAIELPDYDAKKMLLQNLIFCTALYRKDDWFDCGGYDEHFLTGWEDWDFWLRFIQNESQVYKLPGVHFHYRIKKESRNAGLVHEKLKLAEQQFYKKHFELYRKYYPQPITLVRDYEYLLQERTNYEKYKDELHRSLSYRTGNFLLYPFKWLAKIGSLGKK